MRLLLDSHVASVLAQRLRDHGIDAVALAEWMEGHYRSADDADLLLGAQLDRRVLVTYDRRTVPPYLGLLAETGQSHGGVILVDAHTTRSNDIGGLLRALCALASHAGDDDWEDRVMYLQKPGEHPLMRSKSSCDNSRLHF